jgi:glycosyltransferase involved in cell wall biosynthesis
VWLMHQHRSCYELWDTPFGDSSSDPAAVQMRAEIMKRDSAALGAARKVFTISQTVSERLLRYNGIASTPLLQPPPNAELFHSGDWLPYIFAPSRLESLKRQDLLVKAMAHVNEPVFAVLAGEGGQRANLDRLVDELGLRHRVRFLGRISDVEMRQWYANSLAVFFAPLQEDYGFVTLEAMLSSRAVVTCEDSGGPVHFVRDAESGYVCQPDPKAIADRINELWGNRSLARGLGESGRECYHKLCVSWERVVTALLAP